MIRIILFFFLFSCTDKSADPLKIPKNLQARIKNAPNRCMETTYHGMTPLLSTKVTAKQQDSENSSPSKQRKSIVLSLTNTSSKDPYATEVDLKKSLEAQKSDSSLNLTDGCFPEKKLSLTEDSSSCSYYNFRVWGSNKECPNSGKHHFDIYWEESSIGSHYSVGQVAGINREEVQNDPILKNIDQNTLAKNLTKEQRTAWINLNAPGPLYSFLEKLRINDSRNNADVDVFQISENKKNVYTTCNKCKSILFFDEMPFFLTIDQTRYSGMWIVTNEANYPSKISFIFLGTQEDLPTKESSDQKQKDIRVEFTACYNDRSLKIQLGGKCTISNPLRTEKIPHLSSIAILNKYNMAIDIIKINQEFTLINKPNQTERLINLDPAVTLDEAVSKQYLSSEDRLAIIKRYEDLEKEKLLAEQQKETEKNQNTKDPSETTTTENTSEHEFFVSEKSSDTALKIEEIPVQEEIVLQLSEDGNINNSNNLIEPSNSEQITLPPILISQYLKKEIEYSLEEDPNHLAFSTFPVSYTNFSASCPGEKYTVDAPDFTDLDSAIIVKSPRESEVIFYIPLAKTISDNNFERSLRVLSIGYQEKNWTICHQLDIKEEQISNPYGGHYPKYSAIPSSVELNNCEFNLGTAQYIKIGKRFSTISCSIQAKLFPPNDLKMVVQKHINKFNTLDNSGAGITLSRLLFGEFSNADNHSFYMEGGTYDSSAITGGSSDEFFINVHGYYPIEYPSIKLSLLYDPDLVQDNTPACLFGEFTGYETTPSKDKGEFKKAFTFESGTRSFALYHGLTKEEKHRSYIVELGKTSCQSVRVPELDDIRLYHGLKTCNGLIVYPENIKDYDNVNLQRDNSYLFTQDSYDISLDTSTPTPAFKVEKIHTETPQPIPLVRGQRCE